MAEAARCAGTLVVWRRFALAIVAVASLATLAHASSITVPDDVPTIQLAVDSGADTVWVRAGDYPERPVLGRAVVLSGIVGPSGRPRTQGLIVRSQGLEFDFRVDRFAFAGAVQLRTPYYGNDEVWFEECAFDSGLVQPERFELWDYGRLEIARSTITGSVRTHAVGAVTCIEDTFLTGGIVVQGEEPRLTVEASRFVGGGDAYDAIVIVDGRLFVRRTTIAGFYETGVGGFGETEADVVENHVARCSAMGIGVGRGVAADNVVEDCAIGVSVGDGRIERNHVRDCSVGILGSSGTIAHNRVLGSSRVGIQSNRGVGLAIHGNVVGRGGGDGVYLGPSSEDVTVSSNTSFRNQGHGFRLGPIWDHGAISRNIAYQNGGYGMLADTATATTRCNDWFGNAAGTARGMPSDGTDVEVDPRFCDVDADSVTLHDESPLADAAGCGLVGARGVGCDETATLVERFQARDANGRVELVWRFGAIDAPAEAWIERRTSGGETWAYVGRGVGEPDGTHRLVDAQVASGVAYDYRLAWREGDRTTYGESIRVTVEAWAQVVTLAPVAPNPASGPVSIRWSLPRPEAVDVRIHDVAGRAVAVLARGVAEAGTHAATWEGTTSRGPAPSGLYFVRLRGASTSLVRTFLLRR